MLRGALAFLQPLRVRTLDAIIERLSSLERNRAHTMRKHQIGNYLFLEVSSVKYQVVYFECPAYSARANTIEGLHTSYRSSIPT